MDIVGDVFAPDVTYRDPAIPGGVVHGTEAVKGVLSTAFTILPDFHLAIESAFSDGDQAGWRGTLTGTHSGEFAGLPPPSGKQVSVPIAEFFRITGGRIEELWIFYDTLSFMQQLGAVPVPGRDG